MGVNQFERNKKRHISMSEDQFAGQLGILMRELKRFQAACGITDEELFKLE